MNVTERERFDQKVRESTDLPASIIGSAMDAIIATKNEVPAARDYQHHCGLETDSDSHHNSALAWRAQVKAQTTAARDLETLPTNLQMMAVAPFPDMVEVILAQ